MSTKKETFWPKLWRSNWSNWTGRLNLLWFFGHLCFVWSKNIWCYCIDLFFVDLILVALGAGLICALRDRRAIKRYDAIHDKTVKKLEELMTTPITSPLLVEARHEQIEAYITKRDEAAAEVFKRWGIDK